MKKKIIRIAFLCGILSLFGQNIDPPKKTGIQRIFGDKVSVREKPDSKAKVISQISAGSSLKILKKVDEIYSIDGISDYFYQIQNASNIGYIWGGSLADFVSEQDFNGDGEKEILLIKNISKEKGLFWIKIIKKGKVISEYERKMTSVSNLSVKILPGDLFDPKIPLLAIYYLDESESDTSSPKVDVYYLEKDNTLKFAFNYSEKLCDPPSCLETIPIFPGDIARGLNPRGEPNKVILHIHTYDLDNESKHEYSQIEYIWTPEGFLKK
jgi:hypothetical protein